MKKSNLTFITILPFIICGCVSGSKYRQLRAELIGYQMYGSNISYVDTSSETIMDSLKVECDRLNNKLKETKVNNLHELNRLYELEKIITQRETKLLEINKIVDEAMSSYSGKGINITRRNGLIYISMDEKLLFESGKSKLSNEGTLALRKITYLLENNTSLKVMVEGHTDDRGYISKPEAQIIDNWDLSCHRATEVIRTMLDKSSINPSRLTASGRSKYNPVSNGTSPRDKALNRRTEIIITPNYDEIWEAYKELNN